MMDDKERRAFYGFLRDNLREDIGRKAYGRLFRKAPTYWGYLIAIGA